MNKRLRNENEEIEERLEKEHLWAVRQSRRILPNTEKLIFIGGIPRSGTTLMRVMLDAHQHIRCGEETMIIPYILGMREEWSRDGSVILQGGMNNFVIDSAVSAFLIEIISKHGDMAARLCNKDPYTANHIPYLHNIFPNAKFILMIRDGRAIVHSMIDREVPVLGFNRTDPEQMLRQWDYTITKMIHLCESVGTICLKVYYERLIQRPLIETRRILNFLDVPWSDDVLRHEELIGEQVRLNPSEFSSSQVVEKVNTKPLTTWFNCISTDTLDRIDLLAPMLRKLGYDTTSYEPSYKRFAEDEFYA